MKQLFKTTLLAAAVAATCGSAVAGTLTVTKQTHSLEGLEGVTALQTSNAIAYKLGTGYLSGDKITFTFSADALKGVTPDPDIKVDQVNNDDPKLAKAGLSMSLVAKTDNSMTYRVTNVEQPKKADGTTAHDVTFNTTDLIVPVGTVKYTADSVKSGSLKVTAESKDATGDIIDNTGTLTATIAEAESQFKLGKKTITGFDAVIDVAQMRKAFKTSASDAATYTAIPVDSTGWLNLATVSSSSFVLQGEAGKMAGLTKGEFKSAKGGTLALNADDATLTVTYGSMITNDTITFTPPTGDKALVLEAQDFTGSLNWGYASAGAKTGSAEAFKNNDFGEWTLNGATVNIPYMPYGPNASQIIYVSNAGTQSGDISVTVFDDKGNAHDLGVLNIKAAPNRVTKIAPEINDLLRGKGFNGTKASITITVNAPEADITVYASYNVGGADRGYINTDQYKGIK
jgi:hypothetical protein